MMKDVCFRGELPGTSASLSELEPLLSEEDPVFLEVAMDSTVFSTAKQKHFQNKAPIVQLIVF